MKAPTYTVELRTGKSVREVTAMVRDLEALAKHLAAAQARVRALAARLRLTLEVERTKRKRRAR